MCFLFILSAFVIGSNRSSSLRIYASPPADVDPDQAREVPNRLIVVNPPNAPAAPPPPLGKGKRKINLIKYPKGSDFLKVAVRHAMKVGPSRLAPHTSRLSLNDTGLFLVFVYGLLIF